MSTATSPFAEETPSETIPTRGGIVAYLQIDGAMKAADFYARAFGAETAFAMPVDERGRTMHVHLYLNGASLMLGDPYPEYGHPLQAPQGVTLTLPVDDIATWFARAVDAGCDVVKPVSEMFWGDLYGQVRDPFGFVWAMNQPKR